MCRYRRLWIALGICLLGLPCLLYAFLPTLATLYVRSVLIQQGYQPGTIRLGYPGWRTLHIPQILVHQELPTESLSITVLHSRLDYDLASLFAGRIQRLTIAYAAVEWQRRGGDRAAPCQAAPPSSTGAGLVARLTAAHALQQLPQLPWQQLVLEQGRLFRACATGPLRDIQVSGTMEQHAEVLESTVLLQGQGYGAYRLALRLTPGQTLEARLDTVPAAATAIFTLLSRVQRAGTAVTVAGDTALDVTQFAPFLAFALPFGEAVQHVQGHVQAHWQGTVPATVPLTRIWRHADTALAGEAALTVRLPKMPALEDNLFMEMRATLSAKAAESTYRVQGAVQASSPTLLPAQDMRWDVQGTLAMDAEHVWGAVSAASSVQVSKVQQSDLALTSATVSLKDGLPFRANLASGAWALGPVQLDMQIPQLSWQATRLLVEQASLSLTTAQGDALGWHTEGVLRFAGAYEGTKIAGLSTHFKCQSREGVLSLPEPVQIRIDSLKSGIEVTDITLTVQPVWGLGRVLEWVALHDMHASLLGGHISSAGLQYVPQQPQQELQVRVEHLDIQQLLQLEQQQSLEGTGHLDGVLPIILTPRGLQVQDGKLAARAPGGILRYRLAQEASAPAALSEAQLALVVQALTNLHYNLLELGVLYTEDGTLKLTARIEGKNPDWQQGRPIHLNLNLQENVPALLQSLQLLQGTGLQQSIYEQLHKR